jgi:hypothetical protein
MTEEERKITLTITKKSENEFHIEYESIEIFDGSDIIINTLVPIFHEKLLKEYLWDLIKRKLMSDEERKKHYNRRRVKK